MPEFYGVALVNVVWAAVLISLAVYQYRNPGMLRSGSSWFARLHQAEPRLQSAHTALLSFLALDAIWGALPLLGFEPDIDIRMIHFGGVPLSSIFFGLFGLVYLFLVTRAIIRMRNPV